MKEFTAEEMKGCPRFEWADVSLGVNYEFWFIDEYGDIAWTEDGEPHEPDTSFKCDPEDRMRAICKGLFEINPLCIKIAVFRTGTEMTHGSAYTPEFTSPISINPFLHTDRTSMTREEMGL